MTVAKTYKLLKNAVYSRFLRRFSTTAQLTKKISRRGGIYILMYHSVSPQLTDYPLAIDVSNFNKQMEFLSKTFTPLSLNEAFYKIFHESDPITDTFFVVTFDDGFRDNKEYVLPILQHYKIPVTIFVTTSYIEEKNETFMDWTDVEALSNECGVSIGSHTKNHVNLRALREADIIKEIVDSKHVIEERIQKPVEFFCYPGGFCPHAVEKHVTNYYKAACIAGPGQRKEADRIRLPRVEVNRSNQSLKRLLIELYLSQPLGTK